MTEIRPVSDTRGGTSARGGMHFGNDVWILTFAGVPVNGASGTFAGQAGKGSKLIDYTNGVDYINTGTKASPTWTKTGTQS